MATRITIARGDGIGPEIMEATLQVLKAAGAALEYEEIVIGEAIFTKGVMSGIEADAWDSLRKTKVFLKAPITTPQGGGFKSVNVTVRKTLGLYANVRPCVSYHPIVATKHPKMDIVIVRENEEDLYAGVEYRPSDEAFIALKLITRPGSERICRYAFEYARANGRKKVTALVKDNIMKMSDGCFHEMFKKVGEEYPDIEKDSLIVDIGMARIANRPERFDVVVTENLYGDIVSDIAAEITGSVGLGASSNIGTDFAMFEAIHGSAPDIAGQGIANPSSLILSAAMMLVHIGQPEIATKIHNAVLAALESGIHTGDIYREGVSKKKVGTAEFTANVIAHLGKQPNTFAPVNYGAGGKTMGPITVSPPVPTKKELIGTDIWVHWRGDKLEELASKVSGFTAGGMKLEMISARGLKMWPGNAPATGIDLWAMRFIAASGTVTPQDTLSVLQGVVGAGLDVAEVHSLYNYDGKKGFTAGQGQ